MQKLSSNLKEILSGKLNKKVLWAVGILLVLVAVFVRLAPEQKDESMQRSPAQPVRVAEVTIQDMPVYLQGLGTVTPVNTVVVKSRVDGELIEVNFAEGQNVEAGMLLARIDPEPYQTKLLQVEGALARDTALLENAKRDLTRYQKLFKEGSVPLQQLQNQESLVAQYTGTLQIDKANVAEAKLQLSYSEITAPISGRVGFKRVDVGNIVRSGDADGLVVITQLEPIHVVFSIVGKHIPQIMSVRKENTALAVDIFDQTNTVLLGTGVLDSVDNQIDPTTGMVKLKALLPNADQTLYPNQFVNARLFVNTLKDVIVVPSAAVLQGNDGYYVYVADAVEATASSDAGQEKEVTNSLPEQKQSSAEGKPEKGKQNKNEDAGSVKQDKVKPQTRTARVHPVTVGHQTDAQVVVLEGLTPGQLVVVDGTDRLTDGSSIRF